MAEKSSGNDDKNVGRVNSFSRFLSSPLRSPKNSTKRSTSLNPFSRLLGRKSDKKLGSSQSDRFTSDFADREMSKDPTPEPSKGDDTAKLTETAVEEVGETIKKVVEEKIETSNEPKVEPNTIAVKPREASGKVEPNTTAAKPEHKEHTFRSFFSKFGEKADKAAEEIKGKAKEGIDEIKDLFASKDDKEAPGKTVEINEKTPSADVKGPTLLARLTEEAIAIKTAISSSSTSPEKVEKKKGDEVPEKIKEPVPEKKEDNCVTSLAQGLQKVCAPWSSKKDD